MKRLSVTLLALGLAAATGAASAQSYFNNGPGQPYPDRYGQSSGALYDYARVIRVDPVIDSRYGYGNASSQQRCVTRQSSYAGNDGYYNDGYGRDGYARGGYSDPYRDDYRNDPYDRGYGNTGSTVATVIGGIVGAAIGSQVGGGSARYATSALGTMVGGIAGRRIYENSQRDRYRSGTVQVCDPVPVNSGYGSGYGNYQVNDGRVAGYDVTYEYAGRQFHTRTDYHPGDRIRVRVDVRPE